ncbi:MAG TPA: carotenoid oxygenase family protein, partial [Pseudonocardia sp.]
DMFNFGLDLFPTPRLRCYRVTPAGRCTEINSVTVWGMRWNHDFALTKKHLVFVIDPLLPPSPIALLRTRSFAGGLEYDHQRGHSKFVLVPRDGSKPRILEHDAQVHIHMTNAYEDGSDTVVEFVRYESFEFLKQYLGQFAADLLARRPRHHLPRWPASHLVRFRISATGRITEEVLTETTAIEFPQFDWRRSSIKHDITYTTSTLDPAAPYYDGIAKFDHCTGASTRYATALHSYGEPIFVPRRVDSSQDDGWLLALRHDLREHRSALVILDARDLEAGPLAVAHLDHHIPIGFHGTFTSRISRREDRRARFQP